MFSKSVVSKREGKGWKMEEKCKNGSNVWREMIVLRREKSLTCSEQSRIIFSESKSQEK